MEYEELEMNASLIKAELENMLKEAAKDSERARKLESAIAQMDELCA